MDLRTRLSDMSSGPVGDGVGHIFGGKRLAIKLMLVVGREGEAIPAFSFGKARRRQDDIRKIADFLPELNVTCRPPVRPEWRPICPLAAPRSKTAAGSDCFSTMMASLC